MNNLSQEMQALLEALAKKEKLVAMLAPSFPVNFPFPQIISRLKKLGFAYVVEISLGAIETNKQLLSFMKKNPQGRFITNPCPSLVRFVKTNYPKLTPFLTKLDSPMSATAKLVYQKYPGFRPVFIGPCLAKKLEAAQDFPELRIIALTFKEMEAIFQLKEIGNELDSGQEKFDLIAPKTRLYPLSGGLAQSACLKDYLAEDEYLVTSGLENIKKSLEEFAQNQKIKLLDVLFCPGGCVGGPGIIDNDLSLKERRQKVVVHWKREFFT